MRMGCASTLAVGLILILLLAAMAGCVQGNEEPEDSGTPDISQLVEYTVDLYFFNSEYAETGDESLGRYLTESRKIEVVEGENPWPVILDALKTVEGEGMGTEIREDVVFAHVSVSPEDETLMIVDLKNAVSGASMQESFFIGQIVQTLIDNSRLFEDGQNIDKVQFLVKGETVESLMGHISANEPFTSELN